MSTDELLAWSLQPSTRRQYDRVLKQVEVDGVVLQEKVMEYITRQANEATSMSGVKALTAALHSSLAPKEAADLGWKDIRLAKKAAKNVIKTSRKTAPSRPTLSDEELARAIRRAEEGELIAVIFCFQTMLAWRSESLLALTTQDIKIHDSVIDITVTKEKVLSAEYGPRQVLGIPVRLEDWNVNTARKWNSIWARFYDEATASASKSLIGNMPPYDVYMSGLKALLKDIAPRLANSKGVGTHIARRTGACSHIKEGLTRKVVMYLGGWSSEREFDKYLQAIQTITDIQG